LTQIDFSYKGLMIINLEDESNRMNQFQIFVIRAIVGLVFAVVVTRMFYGRINPLYVAGLAIILVGLAYFAEYLRKRRKE
jgi:Flp pilus assembly protein TadB